MTDNSSILNRNKNLKLKFLSLLCSQVNGNINHYFNTNKFLEMFSDELSNDESFDSIYLQLCQSKMIYTTSDSLSITEKGLKELENLESQFKNQANLINSTKIQISREGIAIDGNQFDSLYMIHELIAQASHEIIIIDAYAGPKILQLCSGKQSNVSVKILGKYKFISKADFHALSTTFNKQYGNLLVRGSEVFHDRFIFIDDSDFYHLGASIEHLGQRVFMFSRIEEQAIITLIKNKWVKEWNNAKILI